MADEPTDLMLRMLRDVRDIVKRLETDNVDIKQRIEELHETLYTTAGISMHANVKQDALTKRLGDLEARIAKLEEKA